jgi:methyl-accepting chemotaxis protein/Spy/CpxP family protein refolding chaperone
MEVDRLELIIETEMKKAEAELDKLIGKLNKVSSTLSSVDATGLRRMSSGIKDLSSAMQSISGVKTTDFNRLAKNIQNLSNINSSGLSSASGAIREITNAINGMTGIVDSTTQLGEAAKNISRLSGASVQKSIETLPKLSASLKDFMSTVSSSPAVSQNVIDMTNAMANLASQGSRYNSAISGISKATNTLKKNTDGATESTKKHVNVQKTASSSSMSLSAQLTKLAFAFYSVQRVITGVGDSIKKSMDFTETINLFQTSFKKIGMETASELGMDWGSEAADQFSRKFIDEAQDFNDQLTDSLSLDPNLMMGYQALFAQMSNAMGLTAQASMDISETMTMLGTDFASLFNKDLDVTMKKLQSGLAGQIRPLRELGIDISQTSLEMTALNYGIDDNVINMSQAAKVQLRWLSIMDQAEVAFGDMAKTIDSPANQLRILEQNWTNLSRSIGNVFMPIVSTVLPYLNAITIAIRRMVDTFATAVGFELPDYSDSNIYSDITGDIVGGYEDIEDSANDATDATNKLKRATLGIDDLNILQESKQSSGSKNGSGGLGSGYDELDDAIGNKTQSYMSKFNEEMAKMSNQAKELADKIQPKLEDFIEWMDKISPVLEGVAAAFITYKVIDWFSSLAAKLSTLAVTPGGVIALAIGGLVAIYGAVSEYNKKLVEEDLAGRFGDIAFSAQEIDEIAQRITDTKYSAKLDVFISEKSKLETLEKNIQEDINTLNKLNWKVSVGLELTPQEIEEYKSTIDSFVENSNKYIEQQHYVTTLAIDAVINDGDFKNEITNLVDKYFDGSKGEMERLGKDLRSEMDKALADGILDATEQKTVNNLIKEMSDIQSQIANAEFKAKLQMITIDGELSPDSFKDLAAEIQTVEQERIDEAEEATFTFMTVVEAQYAIDMKNATTPEQKEQIKKKYEENVATINAELGKIKSTITIEGTTFLTNKLIENYETEMEKTAPIFQQSVKDAVTKGMYWGFQDIDQDQDGALKDAYSLPLQRLTTDMASFWYGQIIDTLPEATRDGAAEMYASLSPTEEEYTKIFSDALKSGAAVDEGIVAGLTDTEKFGAIGRSMNSINFMLGQKLSTDETFLQALAASKTAGKDLDDYLILGLKSKIPDLELQGESLVFDLDEAIKKAASTSATENMPNYTGGIIGKVGSTFTNDTSVVSSVNSWLSKIDTAIKNWNPPQINFPAPSFGDIGQISYPYNQATGNKISGYATGGIPGYKEVFYANEQGIPEYVGKIGNKPAVANNMQITEGIREAVVDGMSEVMFAFMGGGSGSGEQVIENHNTLIIGDDVIYDGYERGKVNNQHRFYTTAEAM